LAHGGAIDLAYVPERVHWNSGEQLQLRVKDFVPV
jgi:hypothetical protein